MKPQALTFPLLDLTSLHPTSKEICEYESNCSHCEEYYSRSIFISKKFGKSIRKVEHDDEWRYNSSNPC